MSFNSITFIWIFLPIVIAVYYGLLSIPLLNKMRIKNFFLLTASLFFYAWGSVSSFSFLLTSIVVAWIGAIALVKLEGLSRKVVLVLLVGGEVGGLLYYKYWNFFAINLTSLTGFEYPWVERVAPLGISFVVFQFISYLIDVYRGKSKPAYDPISCGLYMAFFPQLVMGPIVRYNLVEKQLYERSTSVEKMASGIQRFIIGLGKKVLIADCLGQAVDTILAFDSGMWGTYLAWFVFVGYSMQLYYDFSGYTDMALGLGKMFGFDLPENFALPYTAKSVQEFWRCWHITLSNWFRDYVYIPLGGNRKGIIRTYLNLGIVFLLTGLWHGSSWNFVIWGMWHGMFMLLERAFLGKHLKCCKLSLINYVYTIGVSFTGWMFFRISSMEQALYLIKLLFVPTAYDARMTTYYFINPYTLTILGAAILWCGPLQAIYKRLKPKLDNRMVNMAKWMNLVIVLLYSLSQVVSSTYNAFIYQQF